MPFNSFENYPMSWKPQWDKQQPLYVSLAQCLEEDVKAGSLLPGTKLPPQRELADFLDINVSTVSKAFRLCSDKGLLTSVVGSGTFVAYDVMTNLSVAPDIQEPVIELGSMMPETLPSDEAASLMENMLREEGAPLLFQYSYGSRALWHRRAAAILLNRHGVQCKEDHIVPVCGGQNAIAVLLAALCRRGDRLGVDALVYPGVKQAAKLFGVRLVPVGDGEMSGDAVRYAVQNQQIKGLYVVPDFHNPTGRVLSEEGRKTRRAAAAFPYTAQTTLPSAERIMKKGCVLPSRRRPMKKPLPKDCADCGLFWRKKGCRLSCTPYNFLIVRRLLLWYDTTMMTEEEA